MQNLNDLLVLYNNLDVAPFHTVIAKYVEFYCQQNIDVFNIGVSIPRLAIHYSFKFLADDTVFTLFPEKHKPLNLLFHLHLVGGPSIVFWRYLEVGGSFLKDVLKNTL